MALRPVPARASWTIIIPVKDTRFAKTRLTHLSPGARATLALAFALDTATAALGCSAVRRVVAVTSDAAAANSLSHLGVTIVADAPDAGLNAALLHGVDTVRRDDPAAAVAALSADLPAVRPRDLADAMVAGAELPCWFVSDAAGDGTTMLAAASGVDFAPAFGTRSQAEHHRRGAVDLAAAAPVRLRRDVDTEADLQDAMRLRVGAYTAAALARLDAGNGAST